MSTEMKPNPESLMAFQSFPYTSRKIQDGQCLTTTITFSLFLSSTSYQCKIRRGVLRPPTPSGFPIWPTPSP